MCINLVNQLHRPFCKIYINRGSEPNHAIIPVNEHFITTTYIQTCENGVLSCTLLNTRLSVLLPAWIVDEGLNKFITSCHASRRHHEILGASIGAEEKNANVKKSRNTWDATGPAGAAAMIANF